MLRPKHLTILWLGLCAVMARAEVSPGGAEAEGVRFRLVRTANGAGPAWLEAEVQVVARPAADEAGGYVPRVKVTLVLATESEREGRRFDFFRATAQAVALPAGRSSVRFFLPPEIVARDALRGELRFWRVEVSTGSKSDGEVRSTFAPSIANADSRRNFSTQAEAGAPANDGILMPQYLTAFADEYPTSTPTFIRSERAG